MEETGPRPTPRIRWIVPILMTLFAWGVLSFAAPFTPVSSDATRDQLLVRDCVEMGRCHTAGAPTSVPGVRQGAGWIDLLTLLRLLGLDVAGERRVTLFLNGLAVGTLFVVAGSLRRAWAWPAALLLLLSILHIGTAHLLINTSLDVLPAGVGFGALLLFAQRRRLMLLVAAAVALGMAVNFHVSAALLVPALLMLAAWESVLALVVGGASFVITALATSWEAWRMNVEAVNSRHLLLPAIAVVAASILLGWLLRRRSLSRVMLLFTAVIGPFGLAAAALILAERHTFVPSYLHPVLAPLCLLLAGALYSALGLFPRLTARAHAGVAIAIVAVILSNASAARAFRLAPPNATWTYDDARLISDSLSQHGVSYADAAMHVQGMRCHDLLPALGAYMPRSGPEASTNTAYEVTPNRAGALRALPTWLQSSPLTVCRKPGSGSSQCASAVLPIAGEKVGLERFLFSTRMDIATHRAELPGAFTTEYEIPVEAVSTSRAITVLDEGPDHCRWKVAVVKGFDTTEALPSSHIDLTGPLGAKGSIVLTKPFGVDGCPAPAVESLFLPCLKESEP